MRDQTHIRDFSKRHIDAHKGRCVETLIIDLLKRLGCHPKSAGIEVSDPHIAVGIAIGEISSQEAVSFRYQVDLSVISGPRPNGIRETRRVEVKYRANGTIEPHEVLAYPADTHFIFVDPS